MGKYITQHVPGTYLTFEQRQTLASDWNELIRAGCRVTLRQFAAKHGLRCETWRREYNRGATGEAVPDARDRRRRKYAEYDPFKAQDVNNNNNANKGARMLVTNQMAFLFKRYVLEWYKHINAGDIGVLYGQTPYHPGKKPKGPKPHPAMTVPGRLVLNDRPVGATNRSRFGHYEMDTVVSSTKAVVGCNVYYTRAYASWEKGSIENCNRFVRR